MRRFSIPTAGGWLAVVAISFALCAWYQWSPGFSDPDSFYHAKMGQLVATVGLSHEFPWLPFTTLANDYTNHHWLYHWLLHGVNYVVPPFWGIKLVTAILASLLLGLVYELLRRRQVPHAWFFWLLLLTSSHFMVRINLAKAPVVGVLALMIGVTLLWYKRWWLLGAWSFIYVWLYGGWPLLLVAVAATQVGTIITDYHNHPDKWQTVIRRCLRQWSWWHPFVIVAGANVAGLLLHPSFPHNLVFYWQQIGQMAIANSMGPITVGNEWYPYSISSFLSVTNITLVLWIIVAGLALTAARHLRPTTWGAWILSCFFFVLTMRSQRTIEYLTPWMIIAPALTVGDLVATDLWSHMQALTQRLWNHVDLFWRWYVRTAISLIVVIILLFMGRNISESTKQLHRPAFPWNQYQAAAHWLKTHSQPGDIVFHSNWDDFPPLFYYNHHNRYIAGLDPRFSHNANPAAYRDYITISYGEQNDRLYDIIADEFQSSYVLIERSHEKFLQNAMADLRLVPVYEDDQATILRVTR